MNIKFRIICEDGKVIESHDENWNPIKDHAHALPPHNNSPWLEYQLITDTGVEVSCIYPSGMFRINGTLVHPANDGGVAHTFLEDPQNYESTSEWEMFKNRPYFPIAGRRTFAGDWGGVTLWFCGWKRIDPETKRSVEKCVFIHPNGQILMS